jgi:AAA family ATP:ADP antiporter
MSRTSASPGNSTRLERFISIFTEVRPNEGVTALLLMVNVFLLLGAYYIIKPVREALILGQSGAEIKSYAGAAQAILFLGIVPLYGHIANRVNRIRLINGVTAFFISNLAIFYLLGRQQLMRASASLPLWVSEARSAPSLERTSLDHFSIPSDPIR